MSFTKGDFVWVNRPSPLNSPDLAIFLGRTYIGPDEAEVLICGCCNTVHIEKVNKTTLTSATTGEFRKQHIREVIALLQRYFLNELEDCQRR